MRDAPRYLKTHGCKEIARVRWNPASRDCSTGLKLNVKTLVGFEVQEEDNLFLSDTAHPLTHAFSSVSVLHRDTGWQADLSHLKYMMNIMPAPNTCSVAFVPLKLSLGCNLKVQAEIVLHKLSASLHTEVNIFCMSGIWLQNLQLEVSGNEHTEAAVVQASWNTAGMDFLLSKTALYHSRLDPKETPILWVSWATQLTYKVPL